jgi:hypothetical protein
MGEQFAVLMFFAEGKRRYLRRFASAQEACRVFSLHCERVHRSRIGIRHFVMAITSSGRAPI